MAKMPKRKRATPSKEFDWDEAKAFDDALRHILGSPSPRKTSISKPTKKTRAPRK